MAVPVVQGSIKDILSGLIFVAFGLSFAYAAWGYDLGTAIRMGPGYFPVLLGGLLVVLGLVVLVQGAVAGEQGPVGPIPWRGIVLILGAVLFFGFAVRPLGLVPSLFVTVVLAALSSARTGILAALAMAAVLTAVCTLIFSYALGLPVPLLSPALRF